ncbi:Uncharacterised protein [Collinsella aerofaciens]|uniref:Uncharacterized protein n=1 Tax=Collinsella aerofaciens TaxID=74426 RepID=A0A5K1J8A9_9ACTN|nr:Uncharacterised protein [Collinsella aerofaciens]
MPSMPGMMPSRMSWRVWASSPEPMATGMLAQNMSLHMAPTTMTPTIPTQVMIFCMRPVLWASSRKPTPSS